MADSQTLKQQLADLESQLAGIDRGIQALNDRIDWLERERASLVYLADEAKDAGAIKRVAEIDAELVERRKTLEGRQAERETVEASHTEMVKMLDTVLLEETMQAYYAAELDVANSYLDMLAAREAEAAARDAIEEKTERLRALVNKVRSLNGHADGWLPPVGGDPRRQVTRRIEELQNLINQ